MNNKCGMSTSFMKCSEDRHGVCNLNAGKGIKCVYQTTLPSVFCPVNADKDSDVRHAIYADMDLKFMNDVIAKVNRENKLDKYGQE